MCSGECACGIVPFQGVFTEVSHRISQVSDVGGVSRHVIVSGIQLRTVDGIGTCGGKVASGDVSDFAGGICTMCRTKSLFEGVPLYRIRV